MRHDIARLLARAEERFPWLPRNYSTGYEKAHGRLEKRDISVISIEYTDEIAFPGALQVAQLTRYREMLSDPESTSTEVHYAITNLPAEIHGAKELLEYNRMYWLIENRLHYRKDEVFGEDRSTIRRGNGPRNMAALRNLALSIFHLGGVSNIKRCVDNIKYDAVSFLIEAFRLNASAYR